MWRDINMTTIQVPNNVHQHYIVAGGGSNNRPSPNGNWNVPGSRSSYSLPYTHIQQTNQQRYDRQLQYSPSYQDIPNSQNANGNLYHGRPRPLSMYEMSPSNSMMYNVNTKSLPQQKPNQRGSLPRPSSGNRNQRQGDLVSKLNVAENVKAKTSNFKLSITNNLTLISNFLMKESAPSSFCNMCFRYYMLLHKQCRRARKRQREK
jgi:hypothetical protein